MDDGFTVLGIGQYKRGGVNTFSVSAFGIHGKWPQRISFIRPDTNQRILRRGLGYKEEQTYRWMN
jgi:hypothetical protein